MSRDLDYLLVSAVRRMMFLVVGVVLLVAVSAEEISVPHVVNWTVDGVSEYRVDPLKVKLGDTIKIQCDSTDLSNFVYVETEEQYLRCNSSVNNGQVIQTGDCPGHFQTPPKTFTQSIQKLSGTGQKKVIEYRPGKKHYFFSSYGGVANNTNGVFIGGQCTEGLKMIVLVLNQDGQVPESTVPPVVLPTTTPQGPDQGKIGNSGSVSFEQCFFISFIVIVISIMMI